MSLDFFGGGEEMAMQAMPKGLWIRETADGFELGARTFNGAGLLIVPFLLLWMGNMVREFANRWREWPALNLQMLAIDMVFLLVAALLVVAFLLSVMGKASVTLVGDELSVFRGVGSVGWTRRARWSEFTSVREVTKNNGKNGPIVFLELGGAGRLRFGRDWTKEQRKFILEALEARLRTRR